MGLSSSVPWHDRPPREFPVKRWMRQCYGFTVPPVIFARMQPRPAGVAEPREFPARRWLRERQEASGPEQA